MERGIDKLSLNLGWFSSLSIFTICGERRWGGMEMLERACYSAYDSRYIDEPAYISLPLQLRAGIKYSSSIHLLIHKRTIRQIQSRVPSHQAIKPSSHTFWRFLVRYKTVFSTPASPLTPPSTIFFLFSYIRHNPPHRTGIITPQTRPCFQVSRLLMALRRRCGG